MMGLWCLSPVCLTSFPTGQGRIRLRNFTKLYASYSGRCNAAMLHILEFSLLDEQKFLKQKQ